MFVRNCRLGPGGRFLCGVGWHGVSMVAKLLVMVSVVVAVVVVSLAGCDAGRSKERALPVAKHGEPPATDVDQIDPTMNYRPSPTIPESSTQQLTEPEKVEMSSEKGQVDERPYMELRNEFEQVVKALREAEQDAYQTHPKISAMRQQQEALESEIKAILSGHPRVIAHRAREDELRVTFEELHASFRDMAVENPERKAMAEKRRMALVEFSQHQHSISEIEKAIASEHEALRDLKQKHAMGEAVLMNAMNKIGSVKVLRKKKQMLQDETLERRRLYDETKSSVGAA